MGIASICCLLESQSFNPSTTLGRRPTPCLRQLLAAAQGLRRAVMLSGHRGPTVSARSGFFGPHSLSWASHEASEEARLIPGYGIQATPSTVGKHVAEIRENSPVNWNGADTIWLENRPVFPHYR